MKLSCLEPMLGADTVAGAFELAAGLGFDGVDIRGDEVAPRAAEIRAAAAATGLDVPTVYGRLPAPLLSATAAERADVVAVIESRLADAASVGAENLIVVPIFGPPRIVVPGDVESAELALLEILLSELASSARAARVRILLEPLNGKETHLLRSPTAAATVSRSLGSHWVATMADTYHVDAEGQDPVTELRGAGDQLGLVHLSDRERSLPGEGGIDFGPLLAELANTGYQGYLGFECGPALPADRLRRSIEFIREAGAGKIGA